MKKIAYYPGSFDPLTNGHADILRQAMRVSDEVVIGIGIHPGKKPMFDFDERAAMISAVVDEIDSKTDVRVESFDTLVVDAARNAGASFMVRGVRDGSDLDYELKLAGMNGAMAEDIDTIFFAAHPRNRSVTATLVRQIAGMGGDVSPFVSAPVLAMLQKKFEKLSGE